MKALVKFAPGDGNMELRDVPEPSPAAGAYTFSMTAKFNRGKA
jgi:hypothetical protein